jgi:NAD(P)H-flavin reductase
MLIHSKMSGEFIAFFTIPGLTYVIEKVYRWRSKIKSVKLCSVTTMRNSVFVLEFLKADVFGASFSYKEGQYLLLNCPAIDEDQWVPVTITSAPDQENLTLHLRAQGDESWTTQLLRYLLSFDLTHMDHNEFGSYGVIQDQVNHKAIVKVDGPHVSPTQYVTSYDKMMIIGTGIGVTPLISTLNSIVHFLWRSGDTQKKPKHVYFYSVFKHRDIKSFRYLISQVKEACDGIADLCAGHADQMLERIFEFHFFVTSVPESFEEAALPDPSDWSFWGRNVQERMGETFPKFIKVADFTHQDLYKYVEKPESKPRKLQGDVYIHRGRPEWGEQFERLRRKYPQNAEIGVSFSGNPELLEEIDHCCTIYSSPGDHRVFSLHSQKFD